jgi:hypothetical protein
VKKRSRSITVAVDRLEGSQVVMESDDGRTFVIRAAMLPGRPHEGLLYRVPLDEDGEPLWPRAAADPVATEARKKDLGARMKRLRDRDAGGDTKL